MPVTPFKELEELGISAEEYRPASWTTQPSVLAAARSSPQSRSRAGAPRV